MNEQKTEQALAAFKELAGISVEEYVCEQAFLNHAGPQGGAFGMQLSGLACQMLAASFAGQFKGSNATNYLELTMNHREVGPFTVTMQRLAGKTPHQFRVQAEAMLREMLNHEPAASDDAICHRGLTTKEKCGRCSRAMAAERLLSGAERRAEGAPTAECGVDHDSSTDATEGKQETSSSSSLGAANPTEGEHRA